MKNLGFHDFVVNELFASLDGITSRAMFGGYGIYKDGVIFAIIADGQLYFKVNESNKQDYIDAGSEPFVYERGDHKKTTMSYWLLPEKIMDDKIELESWVEKAVSTHKNTIA